MNLTTLKSMWFILKLQFKTTRGAFVWNIFSSIYSGLSSVLNVYAVAKFTAAITAVAFHKGESGSVYFWLGIIILLSVISVVLQPINYVYSQKMQWMTELKYNEMLIHKMYTLSQEQFDNEKFNTKLSRARESVSSVWRITNEISYFINNTVQFVGSLFALILVSPVVGIIVIIGVVPITYLRAKQNNLYEVANQKYEPLDRATNRTKWYLIDPNFMPEIRLMSAYSNLLNHWVKNTNFVKEKFFQLDKDISKINVATNIIDPTIEFGASLYFIRLVINGAIGLDKFFFVRGLLSQGSNSAQSLVSSFQSLHHLSIDIKNFSDVYDTKPTLPDGHIEINAPLTIEFKNVSFSYPNAEKPSLNDVSFVIFPGSRLALVGENGAGKSTLIKLLLRQYLPSEGQILVNGHDIKDIKQESYLNAISNLSQDFHMISHLTIKDNLLMGINRNVDEKELSSIAELAGADKFIMKLKHKYNERMDSSFKDGSGLSGGQMQRIGVARALLKKGDILILDEPTSAIDAKAEYKIFNNIYAFHSSKTTLIVSHRFSTVRKADKIIVMENGKITEYGSHEELLKYGGLYKEMFEAQAEGYK